MSQTLETAIEFANVAELLHHLGDIPADRVRMRPYPGTAVVSDAVDYNERENGPPVELVDGVMVEKVVGFPESQLGMIIGAFLLSYLKENNLGIVAGADGMLEISPNLVRIPDVSFISWDRLPDRERPRKACPDLAPDLAIEIISPGNTRAEMDRKRQEYFESGVRMVWYLYPETRTIDVYSAASPESAESRTDMVDGGDVLPGFELSLPELFARAAGGKG